MRPLDFRVARSTESTNQTPRQESASSMYSHRRLLLTLPLFVVIVLSFSNLIALRRANIVATAIPDWSSVSSRTPSTTRQHDNKILLEWMTRRSDHFDDWFQNGKLKRNADVNGPILDFLIAGFPKCGTTTLEANLGYYAPMPIADVCTPVHQTVYYAYKNWPQTFGSTDNDTNAPKIYRGSKCPGLVETFNIVDVPRHLPRTKLIIGIRHPVLWFQSFWNMLAHRDKSLGRISPYNKTKPCTKAGPCSLGCPSRQLFCLHRSEFHVALARLGKTPLSHDERKWLAPENEVYGGKKLRNWNVTNSVFLYEVSTVRNTSMWDSLALYLGMPNIRHDRIMGNHSDRKPQARFKPNTINICDAEWDDLRVQLMLIAYDLSHWLLEYFLPVATNPDRPDVVVHDVEQFSSLVERYQHDPCGRLESHDDGKGKVYYSLKQHEPDQN